MSAGDAGSDATDLQRELRSRIESEHRLSVASAAMMRAGHEQLDGTIVDTLGSIGSLLGVDRAYVFVIDHEAGTQSNSHEWVADGISAEAEYLQNIPLSTFPWLLEQLRADQTVRVDKVAQLPADAESERGEFEREGIQSILIMPLWGGECLRGFVGFDVVRRQITWGDDYVVGLKLLAQMLAAAITARELNRRLQLMAFHDPLTGLANRKLLEDRFDGMLRRSRRHTGGTVVGFVDIDDFKRVNDRDGHAAGDFLLCEVAARLLHAVRDTDTVARLGGDEFVLLMEAAGPQDVALLGQRLVDIGLREVDLGGRRVRISLSVGLVYVCGGEDKQASLLRRADAAMYRAKRAGKNCWIADMVDDGWTT